MKLKFKIYATIINEEEKVSTNYRFFKLNEMRERTSPSLSLKLIN